MFTRKTPEVPAFDVASARTIAPYEDERMLMEFASKVELVTYEFENIPARTASILADACLVRPSPQTLADLPGSPCREGVFDGGRN